MGKRRHGWFYRLGSWLLGMVLGLLQGGGIKIGRSLRWSGEFLIAFSRVPKRGFCFRSRLAGKASGHKRRDESGSGGGRDSPRDAAGDEAE